MVHGYNIGCNSNSRKKDHGLSRLSDDFVQCVPTKKGHQILYKGYTYVFKSRLHCGAEQWCCSFRQKTAIPEWVLIYFMKTTPTEFRCNICETVLIANDKSPLLLDHIKKVHKEVYSLHKDNQDNAMGFRIEFLNLNVLKPDEDGNSQVPVIIGEVCEAQTEEIVKPITEEVISDIDDLYVKKKRKPKSISAENRKRSWVWKYFEKINNFMFKCTLCQSVLSIKGCNTNNMNRHVRSKHPGVFRCEMQKKDDQDLSGDYENKTDDNLDKDEESFTESPQKLRSWIWFYFTPISNTLAQCKLCNRNICHGGNATGNMNRHLKMIHNKSGEDHTWVWKVFGMGENDMYTCKICQFQSMKQDKIEDSISIILNHLRVEHGVISGDQIITTSY